MSFKINNDPDLLKRVEEEWEIKQEARVTRYKEKIKYCLDFESTLNDFESEFLPSIENHLETKGDLTWKQSKKLSEIFDKQQKLHER